jgi:hypothetical protein
MLTKKNQSTQVQQLDLIMQPGVALLDSQYKVYGQESTIPMLMLSRDPVTVSY